MSKSYLIYRSNGATYAKAPGGKPFMLLIRYDEGDSDFPKANPRSEKAVTGLYKALYDEYQTNDDIKEGDTFVLKNGKTFAYTISFHVKLMPEFYDIWQKAN